MTTILMTPGAFNGAMIHSGAFSSANLEKFEKLARETASRETLLDAMREILNGSELPAALTSHQYSICQQWLLEAFMQRLAIRLMHNTF